MSSFYGVQHRYCDATWGALSKLEFPKGEPYSNAAMQLPDRYSECARWGAAMNVEQGQVPRESERG